MEQIYHVYNRGVEKRNVFLDKIDYHRFIHGLFEFNNIFSVGPNFGKNFNKGVRTQNMEVQNMEVELPYFGLSRFEKKNLLVNIIAFCLMPNHYHLLVRSVVDDGLPNFMRKVGTGYTNYFNEKYDRSGALFQGRYKKVLVERPKHFDYLGYYIHCNPLDLKYPEWREGKINNSDKVFDYLENYKWSSFPSYLGHNNYQSVTRRDLLQHREGPLGYRETFQNWLNDFKKHRSLINSKSLNLE